MHDALQLKDNIKNEAADEVIKKYKRLLYDAEELEESTKKMEEINNEALAIYSLCYDYAISQEKVTYCSFAWNVAGSALLKLHAFKTIGERAFFCLASVLKEVL
ncbi:hypothetical protein TIFTF001_050459 [Ficus carica]|uniref:RDRP C-terminal head domain-containing protein n=1 Tax=Ficus carica TaxID=3494 RepID=A0AA87ZGX9_FICCA|nr:hypothetical protein TIFTF001_050459 [Ficus carica]